MKTTKLLYLGLAILVAIPICFYAYVRLDRDKRHSALRLKQDINTENNSSDNNLVIEQSYNEGNGAFEEEYEKIKTFLAVIPEPTKLKDASYRGKYLYNMANIVLKIKRWKTNHKKEQPVMSKILELQSLLEPHFKSLTKDGSSEPSTLMLKH